MAHEGYNPKLSSATPQYKIYTTGQRFFIPAYPEVHTPAADLASCQLLSPKGVSAVA
jgi:hypothetical protein